MTTARLATAIDGGLGMKAVAEIEALPPGIKRQFAIGKWAKRIAKTGTLAIVIHPDTKDSELAILTELHLAVMREIERRR